MKKVILVMICLQCFLLSGCRTAMDASKAVAERYRSPLQAVIQVSALSGIPCDYQLECCVETETSTATIRKPESLEGIQAVIQSNTCGIRYEDLALDSMMLPVRGMTPADCFDQTLYALRWEVPEKYSYEKRNGTDCLCLLFDHEDDIYDRTRIFWLEADTLDLMEGEYYLDGTLVMRMKVETITFTESEQDA